ncbi:tropomyosin [Thalictrum thalictroides]|uniref:Tropomyosin n=1 Tax=Thalictrum thalictroides TaxID=46969 RepID=A0A7J6VSF7_THATH|nr:tropomyosin [Thalictrum thalictroides]
MQKQKQTKENFGRKLQESSLNSQCKLETKALEQRVETLERELDAAITAAVHARSEKRQAEAGQRAAELRAQEATGELENTTKVFELHTWKSSEQSRRKSQKEIVILKS